MSTTVQLLCMTCCERLSASDEEGGDEAAKRLDEMARAAGWVRIERRPRHPADVCAECAALISESWREVLDDEFRRMKLGATRSLSRPFTADEQKAIASLLRNDPCTTRAEGK